jgi:hypothetical protein
LRRFFYGYYRRMQYICSLSKGELAQLVERLHGMQEATGSNPVFSTSFTFIFSTTSLLAGILNTILGGVHWFTIGQYNPPYAAIFCVQRPHKRICATVGRRVNFGYYYGTFAFTIRPNVFIKYASDNFIHLFWYYRYKK